MKIAKIIKSSALIAILGFGTVVSASADNVDTKDLFSRQTQIENALGNGLLIGYARNPSIGQQLVCIAAVNYSTAVSPIHYQQLLENCIFSPSEEEMPEIS